VVAGDPQSPRLRDRLAALRFEQGAAHADDGRLDEALAAYGRSAELYEAVAGQQPQTGRHRRNLALAYRHMGAVLQKLKHRGEARGFFEKAVAIDRDFATANPNDASARLDLSYDLASLARLDHAASRLEDAVAGLTEALALRRSVLKADPANAQARTAVARAHSALAWVYDDKGDPLQAEAELRRSVAEWEALAAGSAGAVGPRLAWAKDLVGLGDVLAEPPRGSPTAQSTRRRAEVCATYRRALQVVSAIRDGLPSGERAWNDTLTAKVAGCDGSAGAVSHP
jgi:tetratricopeptide (TPR) repeat protein